MKTIIKSDIVSALKSVGLQNGVRVWKAYETLYVDGEDFKDIGRAFEVAYTTCKVKVGNADIKLMNQRELVDFAVSWIECNRK